MRTRVLKLIGAAAMVTAVMVLLKPASLSVAAQGPSAAGKTTQAPKTAWGEPDLQGIWTDEYQTPLQRPAKYANKEFFTDAEIAEMTEWFRAHTIQEFAHGRVRVVEPRIVLEVTFDRVQPSNRHKSGYALRFPRIVRLRPDKNVDEIDTLETVRKLASPG